MEKEFNELQNLWQKDQTNLIHDTRNIENSLSEIKKLVKSSNQFQYGNVIVLSMVFIGISLFFYYIAPVQSLLARTGAGIMLISLLIRIVVEYNSIRMSLKISYTNTTTKTNQSAISFYQFRKKVHGPITISILASYAIGVCLLIPEFSEYFSVSILVLMYGAFLISMIIIGIQIIKKIKKELGNLGKVVSLQRKILDKEQ